MHEQANPSSIVAGLQRLRAEALAEGDLPRMVELLDKLIASAQAEDLATSVAELDEAWSESPLEPLQLFAHHALHLVDRS